MRHQSREQGIELHVTFARETRCLEEANQHIAELSRSMLSVSKISKSFWGHIFDMATFLVNRTGKSKVNRLLSYGLENHFLDSIFHKFLAQSVMLTFQKNLKLNLTIRLYLVILLVM